MRKILLGLFFVLAIGAVCAHAGEVKFTTYYPSPFGEYEQTITQTLGVGDTNNDGEFNAEDAPDPDTQPGCVWIQNRVGIGTTAPGTVLDIQGANANSARVVRIWNTDDNNAGSEAVFLAVAGNLASAKLLLADRAAYRAGIVSTTADDLQFQTGSSLTTAATILSNGNVGIGINNPNYNLEVRHASDPVIVVDTGISDQLMSFGYTNSHPDLGDFGYIQAGPWSGTNDVRLVLQGGGGPVVVGATSGENTPFPFSVCRLESGPQINAWRSSGTAGTNKIVGYNMRMDATDVWQLISDNAPTTGDNNFYIQRGLIPEDPDDPYDAPIAAARYLTVDYDSGCVAMGGSTNDAYRLLVYGSSYIYGSLTATGRVCIGEENPAYDFYVDGASYFTGNVYANVLPLSSDSRFKKNIQELSGTLEKLKNIRGVKYEWRVKEFPQKKFSQEKQIGMIAQEVEKEFPELVKTDNEGYKTLQYDHFSAVLLEAIKEQQKEIDSLKKEVGALKEALCKK